MRTVLQIRPFRRLLTAYGVNSLGTWLGEIALSILVLDETGSVAAVSAVWVLGLFVPSLVGPLLVSRLEGCRPSVVLPVLLSIQGVLFAVMAAATVHTFSLGLLLTLAALDGLAGLAARAVLKATVVASTEPRGLLREGNSLLTLAFTVCMAGGPVLAGVVVGFTSPETALAIDAASFVGAALLLAARSNLPELASPAEGRSGRTREALAHIRSRPGLTPLLAATGAIGVLGSMVLPLEVVLVTEVLNSTEAAYGTVLSLWGAGAALGSLLLPALRRYPPRALLVGAFAVFAVSYVGMGTADSVGLVCFFSLLGGLGNGIEVYATMTAIQERTAEAFQARVGGFLESTLAGAAGAGFLLGGVVALIASVRFVFVASGIGILVIVALLLAPRLAIRSRIRLPERPGFGTHTVPKEGRLAG